MGDHEICGGGIYGTGKSERGGDEIECISYKARKRDFTSECSYPYSSSDSSNYITEHHAK